LPDLNSFDSKEITDKLEKKFLDARLPDEKTLNEDLRQKVDKKLQKFHPDKLWVVNRFVNVVEKGSLTTEEFLEIIQKIENKKPAKTSAVPLESSSQQENKPRTKTKGELKETSKSMSVEESTSDEDGALEQESRSTQRKKHKQTQKPKVSKSKSLKDSTLDNEDTSQQEPKTKKRKKQTQKAKESSEESESDDEETLQQESRSTKGKKQKQKPNLVKAKSMKKLPLNVEDSLVEESSSRKRKQTAKREPKDDPTKNQESRTPKGKEQTQTPPASKSKSMKEPPFDNEGSLAEESSSRKRKQKAKREPKDDPRKVKSSRKRPRLMQEDFGLSEVR
jgi:hypothetical protein